MLGFGLGFGKIAMVNWLNSNLGAMVDFARSHPSSEVNRRCSENLGQVAKTEKNVSTTQEHLRAS